MSAPSQIRVLGEDHQEAGRVTILPAGDGERPPATLAITTGLKKTVNEDAGGWERVGSRSFYAVADAHFGGGAAAIAVDTCLTMFAESLRRKDHFQADAFRSLFARAIETIESSIANSDASRGSETTLLAIALGWGRLFWGSVGDSRLYASGSAARRQVNRTSPHFLAGRGDDEGQAPGRLVCGELRGFVGAKTTSRLALATDGLPLSRGLSSPELDPGEICRLLAAATDVTTAANDLVDAAMVRGGDDNVCLIVIETA